MFKRASKNWVEYRQLPSLLEIDFHPKEVADGYGAYWERMEAVRADSLTALKAAQRDGIQYVLFTHGASTSRRGNTTSRSQVRGLMRSKDATPYIVRRECVQQDTVFLAAIRLLPQRSEP